MITEHDIQKAQEIKESLKKQLSSKGFSWDIADKIDLLDKFSKQFKNSSI